MYCDSLECARLWPGHSCLHFPSQSAVRDSITRALGKKTESTPKPVLIKCTWDLGQLTRIV